MKRSSNGHVIVKGLGKHSGNDYVTTGIQLEGFPVFPQPYPLGRSHTRDCVSRQLISPRWG